MTNLEGRVLRRRRARPAARRRPHRPRVLADLAERLGRGQSSPPTRATVFDELRRASAGGTADYAGITYERIDAERRRVLALPRPGRRATTRAPRACSATGSRPPTGAPGSTPSTTAAPAEEPDADYPYVLTTGRLAGALPVRHADPADEGAAGRRAGGRRRDPPRPRRAARRSPTGDVVVLRTRRGQRPAAGPARPTASAPTRVFAPFHWGGAPPPTPLTNPALDPASRMPEFKVCAVLDRPARRRPHRRPGPNHPAIGRGLNRMMTTPRFLQGAFAFEGAGPDKPALLDPVAHLHRARGRDRPGRSTSAAATPPTSWPPSCSCSTARRALLPIGAKGRHARPAAGGRGPARPAAPSSCTSPRPRGERHPRRRLGLVEV